MVRMGHEVSPISIVINLALYGATKMTTEPSVAPALISAATQVNYFLIVGGVVGLVAMLVNRPISFGKAGLMIVGGHDRVLRNTQSSARQEQLVAHARAEGLCVVQQPKFGHPFLNDEYEARRLGMVISFIAAEKSGGCPEFHVDQ